MHSITSLLLFAISCFFILSLRGLTFPRQAYKSCRLGIIGMCLALILTLWMSPLRFLALSAILIGTIIGLTISQKAKMTELPQTIAAFNGLGGLAAFLISWCAVLESNTSLLDIPISAIMGIFTFSGSFVAFAKLKGIIKNNFEELNKTLNLFIFAILLFAFGSYAFHPDLTTFYILSGLAFLLGLTITLKIGGADMPIIIAVLNAASGLDSAAIGFVLSNTLLIITGALIGVSGAILSYIMCKAMNRSLADVLFGKTSDSIEQNSFNHNKSVKTGSPVEAAFMMENSKKIIIVPGYGMAAAQAQHSLKQMASLLNKRYNVEVKFAIHPIAGRMPGHMNILLAEADIPYETIYGMNEINHEFASADIAYVIGANDITNPLAKTDSSSPIYGMPILNVEQAKTVFVVKRSMNTGYTGLDNPLFYADNTIMLFGDAQKVTAEIIKNLEH